MSTSTVVVTCALLVIACGNSSSAPPPAQPTTASGCGVQIFRTPACQNAVDAACCPLETECGKDPGCVELNRCVDACKTSSAGGDDCTNGCALKARLAYCQSSCQGRDADCPTICAQKGGPAEPMVKWGLIAQCSKGLHYPDGVTCNDHS